MEKYTLKNGINVVVTNNKNTPRTAIVLYIAIVDEEQIIGLYYLFTQLLLQGTLNRNSETLAIELEENAIDISIEKKADYIRIKLYCLNEDVELGLEILQDIIENSTFEDYEKEIIKIKGEFESDLDSAKIQAQDEFYRTIFENHAYGAGRKEIINSISKITKQDLIEIFEKIKYQNPKNISVCSDMDTDKLKSLLQNHFDNLRITNTIDTRKKVIPLKTNKLSTIEKSDANQAQIFMGWILPSIYSEDYPAFILLNTILGSSGLSSRLFLELREKQGLAYTVRSVLDPYILGGQFYVYIATEPKNINVSIAGFQKEIQKIINEPISDEELDNAKNNTIGKRQFYRETNLLEASLNGYYEFTGMGVDFEEKLISKINLLTSNQLKETARKYFEQCSVLSVLAPGKYLDNIKF